MSTQIARTSKWRYQHQQQFGWCIKAWWNLNWNYKGIYDNISHKEYEVGESYWRGKCKSSDPYILRIAQIQHILLINPSGIETAIVPDNYINTMAPDALSLFFARPSFLPSQSWTMIETIVMSKNRFRTTRVEPKFIYYQRPFLSEMALIYAYNTFVFHHGDNSFKSVLRIYKNRTCNGWIVDKFTIFRDHSFPRGSHHRHSSYVSMWI